MGTVSVSLPSDGQTADAADYNVPINTIVSEINGGLDSANIEAGGVVPNGLVSGTGTSWAWQSWTPTWVNLTVSGSTVNAKYIQIGKTVFYRIDVSLAGGNAPSGDVTFTLPVTSVARTGQGENVIGQATYYDDNTAVRNRGAVEWASTTTGRLNVYRTDLTYLQKSAISSTVPFTFANSDAIQIQGFYEAA